MNMMRGVLLLLVVATCTQQAGCIVESLNPIKLEGTGLFYPLLVDAETAVEFYNIWTPVHIVFNCSTAVSA
jgi:hypothetical protein